MKKLIMLGAVFIAIVALGFYAGWQMAAWLSLACFVAYVGGWENGASYMERQYETWVRR